MEEPLDKPVNSQDRKLDPQTSLLTPEKPGVDEARLHSLEAKLLETLGDTGKFYKKMSASGMRPQYNHPITLVMRVFNFKEYENGKISVTTSGSAPWNNEKLTLEQRIASLEWYADTANALIGLGNLPRDARSVSPLHNQLNTLVKSFGFHSSPSLLKPSSDESETTDSVIEKNGEELKKVSPVKDIPKEEQPEPQTKPTTFTGRAEDILDHDKTVSASSLQDSKSLVEDMRRSLRKGKAADSTYAKVAEDWMKASEALLRAFEENPELFEESYQERRALSRALYSAAIALEKSGITEKQDEVSENTSREPPRLMPLEAQDLYNGRASGWSFAQREVFTRGARDSVLATGSPKGLGIFGTKRINDSTSLQTGHIQLGDSPFTFLGVSKQLIGSERNGSRISAGFGQEGDRFGGYLSFDRRDTVPLDQKGSELTLTSQLGLPPSGKVNGNFELGVRGPTTYNTSTRLSSGLIGSAQADLNGVNGVFLGKQERKAVQAVPTVPMDRYISTQYGIGAIRPYETGRLTPGIMGSIGADGRIKNIFYYAIGEGFLGTNGKSQFGVRAGVEWVVDKKSGLRIGIGTSFGRTFTPGGFDLPTPIRLGGLPFSITIRL